MICSKCEYGWTPRVQNPKACPRCKARFDYGTWREAVENENAENGRVTKDEKVEVN